MVLTTLAGRHYAGEQSIAYALDSILRVVARGAADEAETVRQVRNPVLSEEVLEPEPGRAQADRFDAFQCFTADFLRGFETAAAARDEEAMVPVLDDLFGTTGPVSRGTEA